MKLLVTMNMPSAQEYLVHQMTVDTSCESLEEFLKLLNEEIFVQVRLYYKRKNHHTGDVIWEDRGDIILNTAHIGKVQVYLEMEKDQPNDESYRNSDNRSAHVERARPSIRPRGTML
jgi:hypothetical protein